MRNHPRATVVILATGTFLSAKSNHAAAADQHERRILLLEPVERPRKNRLVVAGTRISGRFIICFVNVALLYGLADMGCSPSCGCANQPSGAENLRS